MGKFKFMKCDLRYSILAIIPIIKTLKIFQKKIKRSYLIVSNARFLNVQTSNIEIQKKRLLYHKYASTSSFKSLKNEI